MEITNEFDKILTFSLKRAINFQLAFYLNLLSNLVKWIRYIFRFEMLHALQRKLFKMYRDRIATARSLPPVTHPEIEMTHITLKIPGEDNVELRGNLFLPIE